MNQIPERITLDVSNYGEGQKVALIKGIRGYSGMGLKEAKELSETGRKAIVLRKGNRDEDQMIAGLEGIKRAGATFVGTGMGGVLTNLEESAVMAIEMGKTQLAIELLELHRKWVDG